MNTFPSEQLFKLGLEIYLAAGIFGLLAWRYRNLARIVVFSLTALGAAVEGGACFTALVSGQTSTVVIPSGVSMVAWTFRLDPLSCYFNLALAVVALAVSIYSLGYVRGFAAHKPVGLFCFFYCVLLIGLTAVFSAANAILFLMAWESMALAAWYLVSFDHEIAENRQAGSLFFIMSHAGTACLLIAFVLLGTWSGGFDFSTFHAAGAALTPLRQGALFLLFIAGFGVKAGMIPVHIWLPAAHPAAPSNASALLSAILIKTGIYGIIRVAFDFLGVPPLWSGFLLLAIGGATALMGILWAIIEPDLKKMLAWSTIENSGIILMALGAAMMFQSYGQTALAAFALMACLFHIFNHAIFKALLFLSAGAVVHATGTRNLERMGGVIRLMPLTAAFFLVGALAISALPPLNGFVSEWMIYQSLLGGFRSTTSVTRVLFPIAGTLLALTGALAAACFVRAFGIGFLALPRSPEASLAHEAHPTMLAGMGVLAAACVALGVSGSMWMGVLGSVTHQLFGINIGADAAMASGLTLGSGLQAAGGLQKTPASLAIAVLLISVLPLLLWVLWLRGRTRVTGPAWDCGLPRLTAHNEYTAMAFSKPLQMIFAAFYQPRRALHAEYEVSTFYPTSVHFESEVAPAFETRLYAPLIARFMARAGSFRRIQAGSIHAYLAYIFVTLILLLIWSTRA